MSSIQAGSFNNSPIQFRLTLEEAQNLLKAADGMQSYEEADWAGFPKRTQNAWGVGFTDTYEFTAGNKGVSDGALSPEEAKLALGQLAWDREESARQANDSAVNPNPIRIANRPEEAQANPNLDPGSAMNMQALDTDGNVVDQARNAANFLSSIFDSGKGEMRQSESIIFPDIRVNAFDLDKDGAFTEKDLKLLAGDDQVLTHEDVDRAYIQAQNKRTDLEQERGRSQK